MPARAAAARAGPVHLHVVGVAVPAGRVVHRDRVGPLLVEDRGDPRGRLVDGDLGEGRDARRGARRPARPGPSRRSRGAPTRATPSRRGRLLELAQPDLGERAALGDGGRGGQAGPAVGGHHEHHAVPLGGRLGHRAGGEQRLVVGVGVDHHPGEPLEGLRHADILAHAAPAVRWGSDRKRRGKGGWRADPARDGLLSAAPRGDRDPGARPGHPAAGGGAPRRGRHRDARPRRGPVRARLRRRRARPPARDPAAGRAAGQPARPARAAPAPRRRAASTWPMSTWGSSRRSRSTACGCWPRRATPRRSPCTACGATSRRPSTSSTT